MFSDSFMKDDLYIAPTYSVSSIDKEMNLRQPTSRLVKPWRASKYPPPTAIQKNGHEKIGRWTHRVQVNQQYNFRAFLLDHDPLHEPTFLFRVSTLWVLGFLIFSPSQCYFKRTYREFWYLHHISILTIPIAHSPITNGFTRSWYISSYNFYSLFCSH